MPPEPVTSAAAISALAFKAGGKAVAEQGVALVARKAEKLRTALTGSFKIVSQEITIRCPEQVEIVSIAFEPHAGVAGEKIRFPFGKPHRANLRALNGLADVGPEALVLTDSGFEIRTRGLGTSDLYLLDVEYDIEHQRLVDALVQRDTPVESPKSKSTEYWLHALLKHPEALRSRYGRFDLQDLEFAVDVGIAENVKTVIPQPLIRELEAAVALLEEKDPHKKRLLGDRHVRAMSLRGGDSTMKVLAGLQSVFVPSSFREFVDVKRDFRYGDCERGIFFYDTLPIPTWPRSMKVISRTDLSITHPAAQGKLVYKKDEFQRRIEKLLRIEK